MSSSQAPESQITTLSRPSSSKAYKPWQKDEVERLVGWIEEHVDLLQGKPSGWTRQAKEEAFSSSRDDHISANKIRDKVRNLQVVYNKAKQLQLRSGWGLTEEDVEQPVHDRLEKICRFFWRLDGIWGQKPQALDSEAPASGPDSPADIAIGVSSPVPSASGPSRFPSRSNSRALSSQHGNQDALSDNDDDLDQDTPSVGRAEYHSTRHRSQESAVGPDFTEKLLKAQLAQHEKLLNQRLQHEREMHTATLTSQERITEIMASSQERTMHAVLVALTNYRRRSDSSRRTRSRSRSASPARREA